MSATTKWSPPIYLTSRLYPLLEQESLTMHVAQQPAPFYFYRESVEMPTVALTNIDLFEVLISYNNWPVESAQMGTVALTNIDLFEVLISYNNWPVESAQMGTVSLDSVSLDIALISYNNYPVENAQMGTVSLDSITLT